MADRRPGTPLSVPMYDGGTESVFEWWAVDAVLRPIRPDDDEPAKKMSKRTTEWPDHGSDQTQNHGRSAGGAAQATWWVHQEDLWHLATRLLRNAARWLMANGRNPKKRGHDNSRDPGGLVALPWAVLGSPAYLGLSHPARALLLEVARQLHGDDNGRLVMSRRNCWTRG